MSSLPQAILQRTDVWRGAATSNAAPGIASGFPALDAVLPGGGWPTACLTEILPRNEGIGELRLLGPALARLAGDGRCLAWIAPPHLPYAPALAAAGIDPERLLVVRTRSPQETLWATEQALRSAACGAVLAWPAAARYADLRRLQLAAEKGAGLVVLLRAPSFYASRAAGEASPAPLRLALDTANGGLAVHILKRRGTPLGAPVLLQQPAVARYAAAGIHADHALDRTQPATASARDLRRGHAHA
ncbi:MAG: translesion DNA synthesis-associated protein ImuA [Burkholderiales bacterium]|nr:translesion DNA synthesis-associated protein ImuA [Burkholderiales bacterium]